MSRSATTRQAIIEELAKNGPMTYLELAEAIGMPRTARSTPAPSR